MAHNPIPNALEMIDWTKFSVGTQHMVEVIHINDPASFFARPVCVNPAVELLETRGNPITLENLKIRQRVIYNSLKFHKNVRGEILLSSRNKEGEISCTVQAIDYGCYREDISVENIYLPAANIDCPPMALHCKLHLCEPRKSDIFNKEVIDAMRFFVGKHPAKMTVAFKTPEKLIVELRTSACPDDISSMLALLHQSSLYKLTNSVNRFQTIASERVRYKHKKLVVGKKFNAIIQSFDSVYSFYVAEVSDYKKYLDGAPDFTQYCKHQPVQDVVAALKEGRCCGVKMPRFPGNYERAIIRKVIEPDVRAVVKLIDLGVEMEAKYEDIKYTPSPLYAKHPVMAVYCTSTKDQLKRNNFPYFLPKGFQFEIEIIKLGDGLDVPSLVNMSSLN